MYKFKVIGNQAPKDNNTKKQETNGVNPMILPPCSLNFPGYFIMEKNLERLHQDTLVEEKLKA
jgi:hypothetical protein